MKDIEFTKTMDIDLGNGIDGTESEDNTARVNDRAAL
jgi:hypothetical protein